MNSAANLVKTAEPKASSSKLEVLFGGYSSAGIKEENQDAFTAFVPKDSELIAKGAVATIADGVSSASKAAQASQLAVTQFVHEYYATPQTWSTRKSAAKVITSLNQWLYSQGGVINQEHQWLTTFSSVILKSNTGYIFHVGDSRIARYRNDGIEVLTRDHNRKQGNQRMVLTRALGADSRLEVDCSKTDLQTGDVFLLTCDGVHEYLNHKALKALLSELSSAPTNHELESLAEKIVQQALLAGSDDNVSCLLVFINSVPNRQLAEIERDLMSKAIPPALEVGTKLDGYIVRKILHASIRSHLYLVEHKNDKQKCVLKTPSSNFQDDPIYLQGFKREAWVGEHINHANVMSIKPGKANSKFLYHICEYIEGQTLSEWMHDNPKPSIAQVRDIIFQIINALRAFQRLELVHRDLKPDNVMIDAFGQVKLIDYGTVSVAALDENQDTIEECVPQGSLNYIAPETLLHMQADYRSDMFSLGVICYEMLSASLPYKPMTRAEVTFDNYQQWQYLSIKQQRAELPLWLDLALERATAADPAQRFSAFSEFQAELSKPNHSAIEVYKKQPLLQRDPVRFWQLISAILAFALLASLLQ